MTDILAITQTTLAKDIIILLILVGVGAFGGYLSDLHRRRDKSAESSRLDGPAILHMMQGAAGAIIIVTLAPVDPKIVDDLFTDAGQQHFIKLLALAIIGGYAGGALLETSASQFARRIDELAEETKKNSEETKVLSQETKKISESVHLTEQILRGMSLNNDLIQRYKQALKDESPRTLFEIANRADESRRQHWEQDDKEPLERSLQVFQALVETDEAAWKHWWYASLAYCLKDKTNPDFGAAAARLDKAIELRGTESRSGAYEFNRAYCNIKLVDREPDDMARRKLENQIQKDLEIARKFGRFRKIIDDNSVIQEWVRGKDRRVAARESGIHAA